MDSGLQGRKFRTTTKKDDRDEQTHEDLLTSRGRLSSIRPARLAGVRADSFSCQNANGDRQDAFHTRPTRSRRKASVSVRTTAASCRDS